jgi:hypothetical protein
MIKEFLRMFAVFLLLLIIVMDDFPFYEKMKDMTTQLFLALFVIGCLLYDTTFGFIMGLVLIVIYYEIYKKIIIKKKEIEKYQEENISKEIESNTIKNQIISSNNYLKKCEIEYISPEHLLAAQNNIFDINNLKTEIKGIQKGFNNEKVYGVQGMDTEQINHQGYDCNDTFSSY